MGAYLDFLMNSMRSGGAPHANVGVVTPPAADFSRIGQAIQQKRARRDAKAQAQRDQRIAYAKLDLEERKFGLDEQKQSLAQQKNIQDVLEKAGPLLRSMDPRQVEAGEALLRAAGLSTEAIPPEGMESTPGMLPAAKADEEDWKDPEISDEEALGAVDSAMSAFDNRPVQKRPPAPRLDPKDHQTTQELGVTSGVPRFGAGGDATPPGFVVPPALDDEPGPVIAEGVDDEGDMNRAYLEEDSAMLPQMKRRIVDAKGNVLGTYDLGESRVVIQEAMSRAYQIVEAYTSFDMDITPEQKQEMMQLVEGTVLTSLREWNGSVFDGYKAATDAVKDLMAERFKTLRNRERVEAEFLGNTDYKNGPRVDAAERRFESVMKAQGLDTIMQKNIATQRSRLFLRDALQSWEKGIPPTDTIRWQRLLFTLAKLNDGSGRLSDQDFARSQGEPSLGELGDQWLLRNTGLSWDQIRKGDFSSIGGLNAIPKDTVERFYKYMLEEEITMQKDLERAQQLAQQRYDLLAANGQSAEATGIALYANSSLGMNLQLITPGRAAEATIRAAADIQAARRRAAEQGVAPARRPAPAVPPEDKAVLDELLPAVLGENQ